MSTDAGFGRAGRIALNGPTMGTRWSAIAYPEGPVDREGLAAALARACETVDGQMSTWKPQSDLMRLNRAPVGEWQDVPDELAYVLALGEVVRDRSGGCFDMAVLADVQAAGFGSDLAVPGVAAGPRMGAAIEVDPARGRARRLAPVAFDLSGIAKGFGVDLMARTMEAFGIADYLVAIDGEVQAGGYRGDGRSWAIALEAPLADRREVAARLELHDGSLATSGAYRHQRLVDGDPISHTVDPRTGRPARSDLASVTVLAPDCVLADAWATALLVAGRDEAVRLCTRHGLDAILLRADGDGFETTRCGRFA